MVYVLWIMNHYNGKWLLEVVKQGALTGCGLKRETPARGGESGDAGTVSSIRTLPGTSAAVTSSPGQNQTWEQMFV